MNKFLFSGMVGGEPEVKELQKATLTKFNVRITEEFTRENGESGEVILWVNCEAWNKLGETCKNEIRKGDLCNFEGKIVTEKWETKDGRKFRYIVKLSGFKKI